MRIELLTRGEDGHAIPGAFFDYDPMTVKYYATKTGIEDAANTLLAINSKFLWRGQPVRFLVPIDLLVKMYEELEDGERMVFYQPTREAIRLVAERMKAREAAP